MPYPTFNAAVQRQQIQQQATFLARYHAGLQAHATHAGAGRGAPRNATMFVMPPRANAYASQHLVPVPSQFARQVLQVEKQPIPRSARHTRVTGTINGRPFTAEVRYESSRHFHGSTPLPDLMNAAQSLLNAWPSAEGTVLTRGSRLDHAHPDKKFELKREGKVLQVNAMHRRHSDMRIYPDGTIYLGGRKVTEQSDPVVFRRVASRLNAAENFFAACEDAVKTAPPDAAVQTDAPPVDHKDVRVKAPGVDFGARAG